MTKYCRTCFGVYTCRPRVIGQYCSHSCAYAAFRIEGWANTKASVLKVCESCGHRMNVKPYRFHQRFCSRPCWLSRLNKERSLDGLMNGTWIKCVCQNCAKAFERPASEIAATNRNNGKFCSMSCRAIFQIHKVRPVASKSESIFGDLLESAGLNIMRQYRIGRYVCDFYIPRTNRVIEYDGDYWHAKTATKAKDKRKDEWLLAHGYSVTRVSESVAKEPVVIREIVKANTADMHAIAWRTVPCEWRVEMSQGGSR